MTEIPEYKVFTIGERGLTFSFGNTISRELNDLVNNLAAQLTENPFYGFVECVPAYSSISVFYDPIKTRRKFRTALSAFEIVKSFVEIEMHKLGARERTERRTLEIPVSFGKDESPDLEHVAKTNGLEESEVIEIFLSRTYRVFMLGFLPGFPYMGELEERIATPRRENPRTLVAKGSVGIAGKQTGIYPLDSPGGWQIIGRTTEEIFTPDEDEPTLLKTGDLVKFVRA